MTRIALKTYFDAKKAEKKPLSRAEQEGKGTLLRGSERPLRYAPTTLSRMKVSLSGFADWLIEQGALAVNPVRGITIPRMAARPPRQLSPEQRLALKNVVERATNPTVRRGQVTPGDLRGAAIFALGYYAGLRISDVSHLLVRNTHVGHQWFQEVRLKASVKEARLIDDITFHDLRHDFGHRLRGQGWSLEEVAYYLGHVNADGTPSIQTTAHYTQVGREQIRVKLRQIRNIEGGEQHGDDRGER